jgi:hypothetical protein
MTKEFVRVLADVHCDWEGLPPTYRMYVNDELFAERTWTWTETYLQELLQIEADPGEYKLRWELVPPNLANIQVKNVRVDYGSAKVIDNKTLRITHASK